MTLPFLWPTVMWTLVLIPLLVLVYRRALHRRPVASIIYPDSELMASAASRGSALRRHLPAALFLTGVIVLLIALARPVAPLPVPADRSAIMLSIDVSGSMRSQDILPNRLAAAQAAARAFVQTVPGTVRIGLVAFGGFAQLLVPPGTENRKQLIEAIDNLYFVRRTAIGEGLLEAVAALPGRAKPAADGSLPPAPPGPRPPGIVVLLSDGRSNAGIDPLTAASLARQQEVVVYTIGMGQTNSTSGWTLGGTLDEETLQSMARETGGQYFHASSAEALHNVYRRLARTVGWERRPEEITAIVGMLGALVLTASIMLSRLFAQPVDI